MSSLSERLSVKDVSFKGKRVFLRGDFNVPIKDGVIKSPLRVEATLETINYVLSKGPKTLVLASHLGRANGKITPSLSLKPVCELLQKLLGQPVELVENFMETSGQEKINKGDNSQIFLLENLRFYPEEEGSFKNEQGIKVKASEENIRNFRKVLTNMCDIYINDAFGTAHRAHSSIVGIDVKEKVCGLLMLKELECFSKILCSPKKPMMAILGGAKITDKISLIDNLIPKINYCAIIGGMSHTFLKVANGMNIGDSLFDENSAQDVHAIIQNAKNRNVQLIFPTDFVIADKFSNDANISNCDATNGIPDNWMSLDIGKNTIANICSIMSKCSTIIWNGPAGVFEFSNFANGTNSLLTHLSSLTENGVFSVIGGGDITSAALKLKETKDLSFTHISTGGGASLELLEGKELPGIVTLSVKST